MSDSVIDFSRNYDEKLEQSIAKSMCQKIHKDRIFILGQDKIVSDDFFRKCESIFFSKNDPHDKNIVTSLNNLIKTLLNNICTFCYQNWSIFESLSNFFVQVHDKLEQVDLEISSKAIYVELLNGIFCSLLDPIIYFLILKN